MDRQPPNFKRFLQPSSFSKQQNSNKKEGNKQQKHQQTKASDNQNNNSTQKRNTNATSNTVQRQLINEISPFQLPETQFPTSQHPVQFFKVKQRLTSDLLTSRIGYRVRKFPRIQQDYICYLVQLLMVQCQWLKIFMIEPNYLYFEMNAMTSESGFNKNVEGRQQINEQDIERQQINLQHRVFLYLKFISEQVFNSFMLTYLNPTQITSNQFNQDRLIDTFNKEVVQKAKEKYQEMFASRFK